MRLPVYDGGRNLYTVGLLPFTYKDFNVMLNEEDDVSGSRAKLFVDDVTGSLALEAQNTARVAARQIFTLLNKDDDVTGSPAWFRSKKTHPE
ncbi:Protein argonaute PNH1 [Sesbania bispinosa]|nr:Protein argonaute PNH1 [Sesbania bispinosa]